jgi:hypothetical protein
MCPENTELGGARDIQWAPPSMSKGAPAMSVPNSVRYATLAVWAVLGLAVLRMILTLVLKDDLVDAWLDSRGYDSLQRELFADGAPSYTGAALASLVVTALLGLAAVNLPKGKRWARIVAIVFAVLSVLGVALAFLAPSLVLIQVLNVVIGLLSIAVIGLLVTADANRFFAPATKQLQ